MPTFVIASKCKNNGKCEEICPSDIMRIDPVLQKAYNIEPDMCWECLSCVKACPEHAIEVRPYADISPLGSEISVSRDENLNTIGWKIKYRDSRKKEFSFPIRTTQWNSIEIPDLNGNGDIDGQELSMEPEGLLTGNDLPTIRIKTGKGGR
ncbi:MAG: adenylyl-sulfate reductase subunit beta [Candidatus Thermoplasmatota archaeon]|nr:adenylyl-sulfate reductase subunit beta [Candidatus Thermoplasmatota archaeon]MCL5799741.1 adenylyl-sulfate reductase subunit beta [Candidatus Thermoplasmatota archaeon]